MVVVWGISNTGFWDMDGTDRGSFVNQVRYHAFAGGEGSSS